MNKYLARALGASVLFLWCGGSAIFAADAELVDIRSLDRTIVIELRYGTARNILQRPIYPANMPALVRPHVAAQLVQAQDALRKEGYGLKIWDAYRPKNAHEQLWRLSPNTDYVADPAMGGSLHTCGVAVDATLVDAKGREVAMPTDFDDFTMAAMLQYTGDNAEVRRNLHRLQGAMARAGFYGMRTEWWHFISRDWQAYKAIPDVRIITPEPAVKTPVAIAQSTTAAPAITTVKPIIAAPRTPVAKPTAVMKPAAVMTAPIVMKPAIVGKAPIVMKPTAVVQPTTALKPATMVKSATVATPANVVKSPAVVKPTTVGKPTAVVKSPAAGKPTAASSSSVMAPDTRSRVR